MDDRGADLLGRKPGLKNIEHHLRQLEEALLTPTIRLSPESVSSLLADEFRECGSSGHIYDKQQTLEALQTESAAQWSIADFRVIVLVADVALVTYRATRRDTLEQQTTVSLRSSIWIMRDARWQMVFHQGTKAAA